MNDAHISCTVEQFAEEFNAVNEMDLKYFKIFGLEKYQMRFSTHDPSRLTGDNAKFVCAVDSPVASWSVGKGCSAKIELN